MDCLYKSVHFHLKLNCLQTSTFYFFKTDIKMNFNSFFDLDNDIFGLVTLIPVRYFDLKITLFPSKVDYNKNVPINMFWNIHILNWFQLVWIFSRHDLMRVPLWLLKIDLKWCTSKSSNSKSSFFGHYHVDSWWYFLLLSSFESDFLSINHNSFDHILPFFSNWRRKLQNSSKDTAWTGLQSRYGRPFRTPDENPSLILCTT